MDSKLPVTGRVPCPDMISDGDRRSKKSHGSPLILFLLQCQPDNVRTYIEVGNRKAGSKTENRNGGPTTAPSPVRRMSPIASQMCKTKGRPIGLPQRNNHGTEHSSC